eukprot:NODE_687_length_748_cov_233.422031_g622_i0.p1 GENE.NODE_687_length_748_cov_233.422031_g622_i0~~NODE_687_length_748_cov_233.422031_g622_i0.p1  ORF type:complete len:135 (+),score=30.03 NODE_687_length_748_cov_233.422031_g622_i0:27-407(+)
MGCENLKNEDTKGLSDPYVKIKMGHHEHGFGHKEFRSATISDNLNPEYNEEFTFEDVKDPTKQNLYFHVYDNDAKRRDEKLGEAKYSLEHLVAGHETTERLCLGSGHGLFKDAHVNFKVTAVGWGK